MRKEMRDETDGRDVSMTKKEVWCVLVCVGVWCVWCGCCGVCRWLCGVVACLLLCGCVIHNYRLKKNEHVMVVACMVSVFEDPPELRSSSFSYVPSSPKASRCLSLMYRVFR